MSPNQSAVFRPNKKVVDIAGQRFARLVALSRAGSTPGRQATWRCICDCGNEIVATGANLRSGNTKSCGCWNDERRTKHGMIGTKTYVAWNSMIQRTSNPKSQEAKNYLERGIGVCDRWREFEKFFADMGEAPQGMTLERIDNEKGYFPGNCKWATISEQNRNRRAMRGVPHGVYRSAKGDRWIAKFHIDGKARHIGTYDTIEEAAEARRAVEETHWGKRVDRASAVSEHIKTSIRKIAELSREIGAKDLFENCGDLYLERAEEQARLFAYIDGYTLKEGEGK